MKIKIKIKEFGLLLHVLFPVLYLLSKEDIATRPLLDARHLVNAGPLTLDILDLEL